MSDVAQARTESPRAGVLSVPVSLNLPSLDEAFLALTGTTTPREPVLMEVAA